MTETLRVVRVRVLGRVQGVGYRAWTAHVAPRAGLDGWVRNRADGSVEALFAGAPESVAAMLERCRRGPRAAEVTAVEIEEEGGEQPMAGFEVRPTV